MYFTKYTLMSAWFAYFTKIYHSKDCKDKKTYDALEWIAAVGTYVPRRGEQMVKYYAVLELLKGKAFPRGSDRDGSSNFLPQ